MADDKLDVVIAAPDHHEVVLEKDQVRVLETTIGPGDVTPLQTQLAPTVTVVLSGSHFVRRDQHGETMVDARSDPDFVMPRVLWAPSTPRHTLENAGPETLLVIGVEPKGPSA